MDEFLKLVPSNKDKLKRVDDNQKAMIEEDKNQQPWVEKYRPNRLDDIVYQENVVNALKKTKLTGKMQHLLFYGPPGTGKTSTIIALAKELFGNNYKERILELNASDERGIQVVREKVKKFSQKIISKISTNTNAKKLCKKVIVNILLPSFFKLVNLNSPPIEKAINPNAKSTMIDNDLTSKIYVPDLL